LLLVAKLTTNRTVAGFFVEAVDKVLAPGADADAAAAAPNATDNDRSSAFYVADRFAALFELTHRRQFSLLQPLTAAKVGRCLCLNPRMRLNPARGWFAQLTPHLKLKCDRDYFRTVLQLSICVPVRHYTKVTSAGGYLFGASDFGLDATLTSGACNIGGATFVRPEIDDLDSIGGVSAVERLAAREELCGDNSASFGVDVFEAWLVPLQLPAHTLTDAEMAWVGAELGGVDLSAKSADARVCFQLDQGIFNNNTGRARH
jgi:hypothetical protein